MDILYLALLMGFFAFSVGQVYFRIPLSDVRTETPRDLAEAVIGASTAQEISWSK